jgi:hypothetical protein
MSNTCCCLTRAWSCQPRPATRWTPPYAERGLPLKRNPLGGLRETLTVLRVHYRTTALVTLIVCSRPAVSSGPVPISAYDYDVYAVLLNELRQPRRSLVLAEHTIVLNPGMFNGLPPELKEAFLIANDQQLTLDRRLLENDPIYSLVPQARIPSGRCREQRATWSDFFKSFPGVRALLRVSRVAYNRAHSEAFVYADLISTACTPWGATLQLSRTSAGWVVTVRGVGVE